MNFQSLFFEPEFNDCVINFTQPGIYLDDIFISDRDYQIGFRLPSVNLFPRIILHLAPWVSCVDNLCTEQIFDMKILNSEGNLSFFPNIRMVEKNYHFDSIDLIFEYFHEIEPPVNI